MRTRLTSRLSLLFVSFALLLALPAMAFADVISNNLDASVDATAETVNLTAGSGANGNVSFFVDSENGDGKNGCNLTGSTKLVAAVDNSDASVATVSASSVEFTACGDVKQLTVTPLKAGETTISLRQTTNTTGGTFNLAPASFRVVVAPAAETQKDTSLAVSSASGTYGGTTSLEATLGSGSTGVGGKSVAFTLNGNAVGSATTNSSGVATLTGVSLAGINAGTHSGAVVANFAGDSGYKASLGSNTLTVNKADLTVSTDNKTKTYGDANPALTGNIVGIKNGDNITASYSTTATASSQAGNYPITATLNDPGSKLSNYNVANNGGTLAITKRPITVTADAKSKTYGDADPNLTYQVTTGSLVGTDGFTGNLSRLAGETVAGSPYAIQKGTLSAGNNYDLTFVGANLAIGAKDLTGSFTASDKEYDGNASASILTRELPGKVGTDDVSLSGGTASFGDKNVGTAKTVTGSGFGLSGAQAGNYNLASVSNTTASITAKALVVSATGVDKVYDGNTDATVALSTNKLDGDQVSPAYTGAAFANKHVGATKDVSVNGISISGADVANYNLTNTTASATASITAKSITVSAVADTKAYDGSTSSDETPSTPVGSIASGDTANFSQSFDNKNVGTGKTLSASGSVADGNGGNNYNVTFTNNTSGEITTKSLSGSFTAQNKTYDGNRDATVSPALPGVVDGDQVSLQVSNPLFDTRDVGINKDVTGGLSLTGADAANYSVNASHTAKADITQKALAGSFTAENKVYDGTRAATVATRSLPGVIGTDAVNLDVSGAQFADKNVGNDKDVSASLALTGADAANYSVNASHTAKANITAKSISGGFTASDKVYDGNNNASISGRSLGSGKVEGDDLSLSGGSASFDNKNVGSNKAVTGSGFSLAGADAGNYSLSSVSNTTASITAKDITGEFTASDKEYDGNASASITGRSLQGVVPGDENAVSLSGGTASFGDKNVGTAKTVTGSGFGLSGAQAGNYNLASVSNTTASITAKALTGGFTANDKEYDGTTAATIKASTLDGVVPNDVVRLDGSGASFENANAGTAKTVTVTRGDLTGLDAPNYRLAAGPWTTTANISQRPISVTADPQSKVYGQDDPALSYQITAGSLVPGDSLNGGLSREQGGNVGTYAIRQGTLGNDNYNVTFVGANFRIDARPITVTAHAQSKVYGQNDPKLTYELTNGTLVGTDGFTGNLSRLAGETVAGSPYAIQKGTLSAGGNYELTFSGANLTITPATLMVKADDTNRQYGDPNPSFTATITGFKLNDTQSTVVSGSPNLGTAATQGSPVGPHDITAAQGSLAANSNYAFAFQNGILRVTAAPLTVNVQNVSREYGTANPALTGNIVGIKNGDNITASYSTTATASSQAGNYPITATLNDPGSKLSNYNVANNGGTLTVTNWKFAGYRAPVDNNGVFNVAKAGSSIPMKFSLSGNKGLNIIEAGFPKATAVSCPASATLDTIEELTTSNSGLTYDATADQYNYVWKTPSTYAGKCFRFDMKLVDGSTNSALFKFTK